MWRRKLKAWKTNQSSPDFRVCKDCLGLQMAAGEEKRDLTRGYCPDQESPLMTINTTVFISGAGFRDNCWKVVLNTILKISGEEAGSVLSLWVSLTWDTCFAQELIKNWRVAHSHPLPQAGSVSVKDIKYSAFLKSRTLEETLKHGYRCWTTGTHSWKCSLGALKTTDNALG